MLLGLRHPAIVGGDDQQREIDGADAGDHVLDEVLVARHVDDAQTKGRRRRRRGRQLQVGKAEIDGDAARLLFRQAIGIGAGQRLDQRALAVIDVAGGGDDEVLAVGHRRDVTSGRRRAERADHVRVLPRKNRPQIELERAARDVADHRDRLLAQACRQLLRLERAVRQIDRHRRHRRARQRAAADLRARRRRRAPRAAARRAPRRSRSARPRSSSFGDAHHLEHRNAGVAAQIRIHRRFERRQNQLVAAQRAEERLALQRVDELPAARR